MKRLAALLALAALPGCASYVLVRADTPVAIAKKTMVVTPPRAWNRLGGLSRGPGRFAEAWTIDGPALNDLELYGAVPDGKPLFREVDKRDAPLPRFSETMLPPDVAALFESSYRVATGTSLFELGRIEPTTFAGAPGFRFSYEFVIQGEEVRRKGEATGAIVGGALYLISFEAPAIFYFERDVAGYRALVAGVRINEAPSSLRGAQRRGNP